MIQETLFIENIWSSTSFRAEKYKCSIKDQKSIPLSLLGLRKFIRPVAANFTLTLTSCNHWNNYFKYLSVYQLISYEDSIELLMLKLFFSYLNSLIYFLYFNLLSSLQIIFINSSSFSEGYISKGRLLIWLRLITLKDTHLNWQETLFYFILSLLSLKHLLCVRFINISAVEINSTTISGNLWKTETTAVGREYQKSKRGSFLSTWVLAVAPIRVQNNAPVYWNIFWTDIAGTVEQVSKWLSLSKENNCSATSE